MPSCIVSGCPHRCGKKDKFPGVILHTFPRSMDRIKAWLVRTGQMFEDLDALAQRIYDGKKNSAHRLCSAHFTIDSYIVNKTKNLLRPDALPSIFPPPGFPRSRKRARKIIKNMDSSHLSNSLPHLLWQESSRGEAWTKREYLFQGAETQTDLSCFDTIDHQWYDRSDKVFQRLLRAHPYVFEHSVPDASRSLLAGLKEEQVQLPCSEQENGLMSAPQNPPLLTSIKSENIDEYPVDQHEDVIRRVVIDSPKEEDNCLMFPGLEDKRRCRDTDQCLLEAEEMPKCIVKGCQHYAGRKNSTPGVTLHVFPKDLTTIKKWLLQTNQDFGDLDLFAQGILQGKTGVFRICSAHFAPECYNLVGSQKVLLEGAIPTIFPERDKPSNRGETVVTPIFQNIYLPVSLWTNNVSVVSNIAPWGVNPIIGPGINQDNALVTNGFGVSVSKTAAAQRANEHGNPPTTDFGKSPLPSIENANTCADLPDTTLHGQPNTVTKTSPVFPDMPTKKVDKAVQWPEYENNVGGEPWKVFHDHFYKVPHGTKYRGLNRCSLMTDYVSKDGFGSYFEGSHSENELFAMLQYVASIFAMNKTKELKTARILNQALEIIALITGEEWVIVNKNSIHKGVHQLTGEFPVKCGDVAVFFTMDEWSYIDQHKEDYGDFATDKVPMNRTWEVPEHWDSDPMTEEEEEDDDDDDDDEEDIVVSPKRESSSDWEPDSDGASEDGSDNPERLSSADEQQLTHKCDQCEEAFPDEQALETHKIQHIEKCNDCDELFSCKAELIKHRAENHAVKRFACTICGIQYDYKSQFIIHQRAHTGEKPFHCDDCGAKFGHKSSLLVHQRRHTEGKTFECSRCERRFDKRSEMARHEKDHDVKKPYKCRKCEKTFVQKAAFERHKCDHDDDELHDKRSGKAGCKKVNKKKHKCSKCGKTFLRKANYEKHKWDHDDDD